MSAAHLMTQPVTIIQRRPGTSKGPLGNPTTSVVIVSTVGYLDRGGPTERLDDEDRATIGGVLYLPVGTDVASTDQAVVDSTTYDVVGPPDAVWNPRLRVTSHVRCEVRSTVGTENP